MPNKFLDVLIINFYRVFIVPISTILFVILGITGHKKIRTGLKMRLPKNGRHPQFDLPKNKKPIWFHCSSGEFEYAKPVIKSLKQKHPDIPVLVTYFSPTFKKNIETFPFVDMSAPLPWDTPSAIKSFLRHHSPRAFLAARTDLWPELLFQINKQKIPSTLFSATLSKKKPSIFKFYWSWLYNLLDVIFCVNQNDKNNFLDSGAITVNISGDTRYDQVFSRLSNPKPIKINLFKTIESEVPTFICGSTWSEDEKVIFSAASELIRKKELNVIVAPHEPDSVHLKELISLLNKFKLKFCFYSSSESWPPGEVLIIDQVGILAELYQHSQMALIGGSFKKSVHSVMEALATGNITFVGPFHQNNREALDFSLIPVDDNLRMVQLIQNSSELEKYLNYTLSNKTMFSSKTKIISEVTSRTGASEVILDWIENRTLKN